MRLSVLEPHLYGGTMMLKPLLISLAMLVCTNVATARGKAAKPAPGNHNPAAEKRMDFDGDVVEGLNRRPLDSLTATSEDGNRLGMGHSYRRQKNFDEETQELSRDLAETY